MNPTFSAHKLLLLSCLTVWTWVLFAALINDSQLNDSLEQFIWAQSFELGYWKHPPLSTWLMYFVIHTFKTSHLWTYVLSAILYTVTVVATFKIAEQLFDRDVAGFAAILLTLHYGFTRRAQVYNHNSVLIAFIAITVLLVLIAAKERKTIYWVGAGIFSGLSVLTKYQALVPLIGVLLALGLSNNLKKFRFELSIAFGIFLVVLAPHFYWVSQNDYKTLNYAFSYIDNSEFSTNNRRTISFFVGQIRYFVPLAIFTLLLWAWSYINTIKDLNESKPLAQDQRCWFFGLIIFPLAFIVFLAAAIGTRLQTHWGLQTTQFLVIFVAFWMKNRFGKFDFFKLKLWSVIQVFALSVFVGQGIGLIQYARQSLAVRTLPAEKFAVDALSFWTLNTNCPLRYISGERTISAMISAYSDRKILILEDGDFNKTPWINKLEFERAGHIEISISQSPSTDADTSSIKFSIASMDNTSDKVGQYVIMKFVEPQIFCH